MLQEKIHAFREAWGKEEVRSISRRYFISNGFDGTLTAVGITVGSYLSGVSTGLTVFKVAMGAAIGLATSGVWSVWEIEKAEKLAELHDLEEDMLKDLEGTVIHESKKQGRIINSVMSGSGPVIGVFVTSSVFLLEGTFFTMLQATAASVLMGVTLLFVFGVYMADISEQNWLKAGLRMGVAGIVVALLNIFLPG
ncbi:MAG: VIT1/CCC1 transporter family protein [Candidatus Nanosalina sp.]